MRKFFNREFTPSEAGRKVSMMENFMISLEIMGKGMLGIFAAALIIWFAVWIMGKLLGGKEENKSEA